jgi:hypothetical protein
MYGPPSCDSAFGATVISSNMAKHRPSKGSWSDDMWLFDFGNDDDFHTALKSNNALHNHGIKWNWIRIALLI